ncbi:MAG TPA: hypothetical protein GX692_02730 [Acholeplasmataceae bacterium]|nr:hypothetical protein [Acholeplasmataceae bacterium]
MKHTYLFEEGRWIATGVYSDEKGEIVQVEGQTIIIHKDEVWINEGSMKVLTNTPVEFFNKYEIIPFVYGSEMTNWKSFNPALGELKGKFMIVQDSIMSKYASVDGQYTGFEYLKKIDDLTYENRGFALRNDEKLSSWAVQLKKIK